jgi:hypothetical protein
VSSALEALFESTQYLSPHHPSETAEDVLFPVQNHSQSVCVAVTSAVKFFCFETIATVAPQHFEILRLELCGKYEMIRKSGGLGIVEEKIPETGMVTDN